MNDFILKIGCFLIGRNYKIIKNCSEASVKTVKRYFSAILIVCFLWGFIGYTFTDRYLQAEITTKVVVTIVLIFIVIQIERQIILSIGKKWSSALFRILIGLVMAVIGSVIIDQTLFKQDIEKKKEMFVQEEVNKILPLKTKQLDNEIYALDTLISLKEKERVQLINDIETKPFIKSAKTELKTVLIKIKDISGEEKDTLVRKTDLTFTDVLNPKAELITLIDKQIENLQNQKSSKENARLTIRQDIEKELKSKTGFLDELIVLFSILLSHKIALFVWIILFIFFFAIELFVLFNKLFDTQDDYDDFIINQMEIYQINMKKLLEKNSY